MPIKNPQEAGENTEAMFAEQVADLGNILYQFGVGGSAATVTPQKTLYIPVDPHALEALDAFVTGLEQARDLVVFPYGRVTYLDEQMQILSQKPMPHLRMTVDTGDLVSLLNGLIDGGWIAAVSTDALKEYRSTVFDYPMDTHSWLYPGVPSRGFTAFEVKLRRG